MHCLIEEELNVGLVPERFLWMGLNLILSPRD